MANKGMTSMKAMKVSKAMKVKPKKVVKAMKAMKIVHNPKGKIKIVEYIPDKDWSYVGW